MVPPNDSSPGMSGRDGSLNIPRALTTTSASTTSPADVASRHTERSSSQVARTTSVPNRQ